MTMILKQLSVRRKDTYELNPGSFVGEVRFVNEQGGLTIHLSNELSRRVLEICAEELVNAAKDVAKMMVTEVINQAIIPPLLGEKT